MEPFFFVIPAQAGIHGADFRQWAAPGSDVHGFPLARE
jgi:hypothetical protein